MTINSNENTTNLHTSDFLFLHMSENSARVTPLKESIIALSDDNYIDNYAVSGPFEGLESIINYRVQNLTTRLHDATRSSSKLGLGSKACILLQSHLSCIRDNSFLTILPLG